jgi:excinuclease ABC subunit C
MSKFPESLILKIRQVPVDPGCYLFKNDQSKIIYIGKAKNLKNRVKTYFTKNQSKDPKTLSLVKKIHDVEFIATHSEVEALILENTLIKQHHPRYNILLKDDKTFPYVRITSEPYPRVLITRKLINDGSKYFGPYTDSKAIKNILRIIKKAFTVRSCQYCLDSATIQSKKIKLCLQYHIHNCEGPCQDLISENDYNLMIANVEAFLKGNISRVIHYLKDKMEKVAQDLRYEIAARIRDNINLLQHYSRRQSVEFRDFKDRDFINLVSEGDVGVAIVVRVRQGKMVGKDTIVIEGVSNSEPAEVLRNFIQQYYNNSQLIPVEINVSEYPTQREILEKWLSTLHQGSVKIRIRLVRKNYVL